jgi:hypothetical protein
MPKRSAKGAGVALAAMMLGLLAQGCGLSRESSPTRPSAGGADQVTGLVSRTGAPLENFKVKLYEDVSGVQVDSTTTTVAGEYGFAGVPAGRWMVKVSPVDAGDLGYVRYFFSIASAGERQVLPPFDVSSHGLGLVTPAAGVTVQRPGFAAPLTFAWNAYGAPYQWTSARVSDSLGATVWSSIHSQGTSASWNGLGNDGAYTGQAAPPGRYRWRVRVRLSNSVQAATTERELVIP